MHVALRSSALLATFQRASLCPGVLPNQPQVVRNAEIQLQFGACLWMPWPVPPQLLRHTNGGCIPTGFGRGMGFASHQVIQCSMDSMLLALRPLDEPGGSCKSKRSCDCALSIFLVQKVESFLLFWSHVSHVSLFLCASCLLDSWNWTQLLVFWGSSETGTSTSWLGLHPQVPLHLAQQELILANQSTLPKIFIPGPPPIPWNSICEFHIVSFIHHPHRKSYIY